MDAGQEGVIPFLASGTFLYPLKTSESKRLSHVFKGYRKKPMAYHGLTNTVLGVVLPCLCAYVHFVHVFKKILY